MSDRASKTIFFSLAGLTIACLSLTAMALFSWSNTVDARSQQVLQLMQDRLAFQQRVEDKLSVYKDSLFSIQQRISVIELLLTDEDSVPTQGSQS